MVPAEYLKKPYGRVVVPESDGAFRAEIIEFPGCIAVGDTSAEALANLEEIALTWLEAVLEKGQRVPEPIETSNYSGNTQLRMSKSLHKKVAYAAACDRVSINSFINTCLAEAVGEKARGQVIAQVQAMATFQVAGTVSIGQAETKQLTTGGTPTRALLRIPAFRELETHDA